MEAEFEEAKRTVARVNFILADGRAGKEAAEARVIRYTKEAADLLTAFLVLLVALGLGLRASPPPRSCSASARSGSSALRLWPRSA
ncbi:MAG: hypothetical protein ACLVL7_05395 [Anaerotruncus massiliensis (ex Togo et al. 2019)]